MVKEATARRHSEAATALASDLGQRIRTARLERGLTLAALGGDDFSRSYLSLVETGRSRPSLAALAIIARHLDLPVSYFLDGSADSAVLALELSLDEAERAIGERRPGEALQILSTIEQPQSFEARFLYLRGWALTEIGQRREAIGALQDALERVPQGDPPRFRIQIHYALSRALYELGNAEEATFHIHKALEQAREEIEDAALIGRLTVALGHNLCVGGRFDEALAHYARARDLFGKAGDLENLAAVYAGLSRIYQHKDNLQEAVRYSRMSMAIYEARHNQRYAAHELNNMAARLADMGKVEEAFDFAREAVEKARTADAPDEESLARTTLAAILEQRGDSVAAKREAEQALAMAGPEVGLVHADAWIVLAKVAGEEDNFADSDRFYRQALGVLEDRGRHARFADTALAYSLALQKRGDTQGALTFALAAAQQRAARPT